MPMCVAPHIPFVETPPLGEGVGAAVDAETPPSEEDVGAAVDPELAGLPEAGEYGGADILPLMILVVTEVA